MVGHHASVTEAYREPECSVADYHQTRGAAVGYAATGSRTLCSSDITKSGQEPTFPATMGGPSVPKGSPYCRPLSGVLPSGRVRGKGADTVGEPFFWSFIAQHEVPEVIGYDELL